MEELQRAFITLLDSYTVLSAVAKDALVAEVAFSSFSRDAYIITEGKSDTKEYFVLEGIIHRFNISEEGKEVTTGFYYPPSVVVPHFARTLRSRSIFSLQALTDATVAYIPARVFDALRVSFTDIGRFGQMVVERELSAYILQETVFRSCNARQRLERMRTVYPNLENLVPHHTIASYLGITPVSFSRLRNEMAASR